MSQYKNMQALMLTKFASKSDKHVAKMQYIFDKYANTKIIKRNNYFVINPVCGHIFPIELLDKAIELQNSNIVLSQ